MVLTGLPVDFKRRDQTNAGLPLAIHAAVAGLYVQPFNDTPLRRTINLKVSFPKGTEYESFRVETEMVWKNVHIREGWEGYHYASKFVEMLKDHYLILERLFRRLSGAEEASIQTHHSGASS